jgi:phytoene/squalene synthetase
LFGENRERYLAYSDAVCSALQLINFLQDLREDLSQRNRLYIPQDDLERFGVGEKELAAGEVTPGVKALIAHQGRRAMKLLRAGAPLGSKLGGRLGLELRLIVVGGAHVLQTKLNAFDQPYLRPKITLSDSPMLLWRAVCSYGPA